MFTRAPIEINFSNTCPMDMKLNQSGQDMSLSIMEEIQALTKKLLSNLCISYFSLIVNVCFWHKDGDGQRYKFDIIIVVSW